MGESWGRPGDPASDILIAGLTFFPRSQLSRPTQIFFLSPALIAEWSRGWAWSQEQGKSAFAALRRRPGDPRALRPGHGAAEPGAPVRRRRGWEHGGPALRDTFPENPGSPTPRPPAGTVHRGRADERWPRCSAGCAPTTAEGRTPRSSRPWAMGSRNSTGPSCCPWKSTIASTSFTLPPWRMQISTTSPWCCWWASTPQGRPPSSGEPARVPQQPTQLPRLRSSAQSRCPACLGTRDKSFLEISEEILVWRLSKAYPIISLGGPLLHPTQHLSTALSPWSVKFRAIPMLPILWMVKLKPRRYKWEVSWSQEYVRLVGVSDTLSL